MGVTVGKEQLVTMVTNCPLIMQLTHPCRHKAGQVGQIYVRTIRGLAAETHVKLNTGRIVEGRIVLRL